MPHFVAIVGPSGSGKTRLAQQLIKELPRKAIHLGLDHFYQNCSPLPEHERDAMNYDDPQTIDWEAFENVLTTLQNGRATETPQYDFKTHTRFKESLPVNPAPLILVEGPWLLQRPSLREIFSLTVFTHCPVNLCLQRRLNRDTRERGRSEASVLTQYEQQVLPMADLHVRPQIAQADLVITTPPTTQDRNALLKELRSLLHQETV